ncbi:ribonuclease P/MRP protein subunit RPP1, partial [Phenoliferia sp. Uapishka_3]
MHGFIDTFPVPLHLPTAGPSKPAKGKGKAQEKGQDASTKVVPYDVVDNWTEEELDDVQRKVAMASLLGYSTVMLKIAIPSHTNPATLVFPTPLFPSLDPRTAPPGTEGLVLQLWRIEITDYSDDTIKSNKGTYGLSNSTAPLFPPSTTLLSLSLSNTSLNVFSHAALSLSPPSLFSPSILSIDPSLAPRLPFPLKRGLVNTLLRAGVFFEISLRGMVCQDDVGGGGAGGRRRNWIAGAREIVRATAGTNVILASGAVKAGEMRGSADLINLLGQLNVLSTSAGAVGRRWLLKRTSADVTLRASLPPSTSRMSTAIDLPGDVISHILSLAIASLPTHGMTDFDYPSSETPPSHLEPSLATRRSFLVSTSRISQIWRQESQRTLFLTESSLSTRREVQGWCVAAGRYPVPRLSIRNRDYRRKRRMTSQDFMDVLDCLSSKVLHLDIDITLMSGDVLAHPTLSELSSLRILLDNPIISPPISAAPHFHLDALDIRLDLCDKSPALISSIRSFFKELEPSVFRAKEIKIFLRIWEGTNNEEELAIGIGDLLRAASSTLESLRLRVNNHPYLHDSLRSLQSLKKLVDEESGIEGDTRERMRSLPKSLRQYHCDMNSPGTVRIHLEALIEEILVSEDFLPELEEVGVGMWDLEELELAGLKELSRKRPEVRVVNS